MTYDQYKALIKNLGYKIKDVLAAGDYSKDAAQRDALRNGGIVSKRYIMLLTAYHYEHDSFLHRASRHRDNKTLNALLDELDSKADSSQEKDNQPVESIPPLWSKPNEQPPSPSIYPPSLKTGVPMIPTTTAIYSPPLDGSGDCANAGVCK